MKAHLYPSYKLHGIIFISFIVIGAAIGQNNIIPGLGEIILQPDILITDYVEIAGIGPTLVNSGLLSLMILIMYMVLGLKPNGSTIMSMWLIAGFAFFGKNILNVWPVILGVFLYSKYKKEHFSSFALVAVLGTSLAPAVSQLAFQGSFYPGISLACGVLVGIFIGFILPPLAAGAVTIHHGYNLYNIGFAGGLLAMVLMSLLRLAGIEFESRLLWSTGNNVFFAVLLYSIFIILIVYGFLRNNKSFENVDKIITHSGKLVTDYYMLYGNAAYINMGALGIITTTFVLAAGGDLNGPTIAGIFTIVGFGAFGKHGKNIIPVMAGAALASFLNAGSINTPALILCILFSTGLAPIAGQYGWIVGTVTGFLHVAVCMNIGTVHGGMILYSNGFAAGFVAMIMLPIIKAFRRGDAHEQ